jgi:hypothetical protein
MDWNLQLLFCLKGSKINAKGTISRMDLNNVLVKRLYTLPAIIAQRRFTIITVNRNKIAQIQTDKDHNKRVFVTLPHRK